MINSSKKRKPNNNQEDLVKDVIDDDINYDLLIKHLQLVDPQILSTRCQDFESSDNLLKCIQKLQIALEDKCNLISPIEQLKTKITQSFVIVEKLNNIQQDDAKPGDKENIQGKIVLQSKLLGPEYKFEICYDEQADLVHQKQSGVMSCYYCNKDNEEMDVCEFDYDENGIIGDEDEENFGQLEFNEETITKIIDDMKLGKLDKEKTNELKNHLASTIQQYLQAPPAIPEIDDE